MSYTENEVRSLRALWSLTKGRGMFRIATMTKKPASYEHWIPEDYDHRAEPRWYLIPPLPERLFEKHLSENGVFAVAPAFYQLAIVDVDKGCPEKTIRHIGTPPIHRSETTRGVHLFYPVEIPEDTLDWSAKTGKVEAEDGSLIWEGEIPAMRRYAKIHSPDDFLKAVDLRRDWTGPKPLLPEILGTGYAKSKRTCEPTEIGDRSTIQAQVEEIADRYGLTKSGDKYVGGCPFCGEGKSGTRFQVSAGVSKTLMICRSCSPEGFDPKQIAQINATDDSDIDISALTAPKTEAAAIDGMSDVLTKKIIANGDFPNLSAEMTKAAWECDEDNPSPMFDAMSELGGIVIKKRHTADTLGKIIPLLGFQVEWNIRASKLRIRHPLIPSMHLWQSIGEDNKKPLMALTRGIQNTCFVMSESFVKEGKKKQWYGYEVDLVPGGWFSRFATLHEQLLTLVGTSIVPEVDDHYEILKAARAMKAAMSPNEIAECVDLAKNWLNKVPGWEVANPGLASAASKLGSVILANRLMQSDPTHTKQPVMQRAIPVLVGPPDLGKTSVLSRQLPVFEGVNESAYESAVSTVGYDRRGSLEMYRNTHNAFITLWDELHGVDEMPVAEFKEFVTATTPTYRLMRKDSKNYPRTTVLWGSCNGFDNLGHDAGKRARLLPVEVKPSDPSQHAQDRFKLIEKWMAANAAKMFVGGLTLAEMGVNYNPDESVAADIRSAQAANVGDMNPFQDIVDEICNDADYLVRSPTNGGMDCVRLIDVALHAGITAGQRGDEEALTPPFSPMNYDRAFEEQLKMRWRTIVKNRRWEIRMIKEAFSNNGWEYVPRAHIDRFDELGLFPVFKNPKR